MKTTLIFLTLVFTAAWVGCSDNVNVTDPLEEHNSYAQSHQNPNVIQKDPTIDQRDPAAVQVIDQIDPTVDERDPAVKKEDQTADDGNIELLWSMKELRVRANSENIAENEAVYDFPLPVPPLSPTKGYMVTFDVSTNAEKTTNGYSPYVNIYKNDGVTLFEGSDFTSSGGVSEHKEISFKEDNLSQMVFYIALFKSESGPIDDGNVYTANLTLKNISIFKLN